MPRLLPRATGLSLLLFLPTMLACGNDASSGASSISRQDQEANPAADTEQIGSLGTNRHTTPGAPQPKPSSSSHTNTNDLCYKADPFLCAVEAAVVAQTNALRTQPLRPDAGLAFVARDWSKTQSQSQSISHNGFPKQRYTIYKNEFGSELPLFIDAENVAYSWARTQDAEAIAKDLVSMWYNSPGHRANMLGQHLYIGVGVWVADGSVYATQIFADPP